MDDLLAVGDVEGSIIWKRILHAINDITAPAEPGESIN